MTKRPRKEQPDPIDVHVGSRVRARRMGLRISQAEIGKVLGVTFQQIQKYENGANRIGSSNLYKLSQALEVDVSFFFDGLSTAKPSKNGPGLSEQAASFEHDPMLAPESIKLVHNYFRITNPKIRQRMFQLVKTIADNPEDD